MKKAVSFLIVCILLISHLAIILILSSCQNMDSTPQPRVTESINDDYTVITSTSESAVDYSSQEVVTVVPSASTETPQTSEGPAAPTEWPIPTDADPQDLYALDPEKSPLPSSDIFLDFQVGTPLTEVYRRVGLPQRTSNTKGLLEGRSMALPVTLFEYDTIDGKTFYIFYSRTEKDVGKLDGYKVSFISDEKPLGILL